MTGDYQTFRVIYEITSAIICFILLKFMIKPYQMMGENRYLGLPLGFGLLGLTYAISAAAYFQPFGFGYGTLHVQLVLRTFAFLFLSLTYYFSRKSPEKNRYLWNIILFLLIGFFLASLGFVILPDNNLPSYQTLSLFVRIINLMLILYICAHTLEVI